MKLQRSTLVLVGCALGLGLYAYVGEIRQSEQQAKVSQQEQQIFAFSRDDVQSFTVTTPNQTITVERGETGAAAQSPWKITAPQQVPANQATVDELLRQLTTNPVLPSDVTPGATAGIRRFTAKPEQLQDYGLEGSGNQVEVKLKNSTTHRLVFGTLDFSNVHLYAQADPPQAPTDPIFVLLVPASVLAAASLPLDEWKLPATSPADPETPPETPSEPSSTSN
ncbi:MAG: DUF4340 domain-containing protein [Oscillatoriales cyanobacterium RM2_1_1]|nr:DUF4340 domain-containing protein [Oscillatoriales cyanobacterium SM2_3_0]NJO44161.1 DUF4340 domain-containing protein [Oscillatoriales cyanobacterium RM2_1_1]